MKSDLQTAQLDLNVETSENPVGTKAPEPVPATDTPLPVSPPPTLARDLEATPAFKQHLVVSIHDVSPLTREAAEKILVELEALGVSRFSLLVIPDHHCKGHVLDDPEFCQWLKRRADSGDEVVLHGYHHRRDMRARETLRDKLTTRYYTAGEGEFFDIAGADALRIISQARQEFRKIGFDPQGFVAPAWLLSEGAGRALQRLGIAYTTHLGGVYDYTTGIHHASQSLVWSTRSPLRRVISLLWNASLFRRLQSCPLLRIGIHPADIKYRAVWKQIKALTAKALANRVSVTYSGYLRRDK